MRILQVIHGYPPRYNAGSEVYTRTLTHELSRLGHEVAVFSRTEESFRPEYEMNTRRDPEHSDILEFLVNMANSRERYSHRELDDRFDEVLDEFQPDVVHVGHLNHLSTSVVDRATQADLPVVFTLHDYWLMCPRGQFVQTNSVGDPWRLCDGQENHKCAVSCYARHFTGQVALLDEDTTYWTRWVDTRMQHIRHIADLIDLFVAPSSYLLEKFKNEFGVPSRKIVYLDYGFDHEILARRKRCNEKDFVFGYIGTHTPPKGIHLLLEAFRQLKGNVRLRIWGRTNGQFTTALKAFARESGSDVSDRIEWLSEFDNDQIVPLVFNHIDAIVVPSIWIENSPLVIHEAQQARVPVITANMGGMAEYVSHEVNGLLFEPRDSTDLARQMKRLADNPELAARLGQRGYIKSQDGNVLSIREHATTIISLYKRVLSMPVIIT